ncbi:hypothetical protein [Pendulispora albinea]|uniref:Glutamine synthetase family protein n=1 Tax=Pendulispora albinea TaxID=2741071 RepID=A0ABZ2LZT3_9BACT
MTNNFAGKRLRLLWSDLLGLERGKYLYGKKAESGHTNFAITTFVTMLDKTILSVPGLAYDVGLADMQSRCDTGSLRPGWEPDTLVAMSDLARDGSPLPIDPRQVLRRACVPWLEMGLYPQLAFELEFYLLAPAVPGARDIRDVRDIRKFQPIEAPAPRVYGTGPAVDPDGVLDEMARAAVASGFPIEGFSTEFDDAQFEINLGYRDALAAADDAFLLRVLVREVAMRLGHRATFLGKPFAERAGSGMHVNLSFRTTSGENALWDPNTADGLSLKAQRCVGGLLAHHDGLAAIFAPNVYAYRRLRPGQMNGYWANWGYDDRTAAVRIPPERGAGTRLEHRTPDGASNPYLVAAAMLHAARLGVEQGIAPPPPQRLGGKSKASAGAGVGAGVCIPDSLPAALAALAADTPLCAALDPELVRVFTAVKRAEWEHHKAAFPDAAPAPISAAAPTSTAAPISAAAPTSTAAPDEARAFYLSFF